MTRVAIVPIVVTQRIITRREHALNRRKKSQGQKFLNVIEMTRNYEFSAPSAASAVVLGHTLNGNMDWKTVDGIRLKDL